MTYRDIRAARFLARPNRFLAQVELDGREETVHVKNTGRCKELLLPGSTVYLERGANPRRKTAYDLVAVEKLRPGRPPLLVNMDAQAPNRVFGEWMGAGLGAGRGRPPAADRPSPPSPPHCPSAAAGRVSSFSPGAKLRGAVEHRRCGS